MPYVKCPACASRTFVIAAWAPTDDCPSCGRALTTTRSGVATEELVQRHLYGTRTSSVERRRPTESAPAQPGDAN